MTFLFVLLLKRAPYFCHNVDWEIALDFAVILINVHEAAIKNNKPANMPQN